MVLIIGKPRTYVRLKQIFHAALAGYRASVPGSFHTPKKLQSYWRLQPKRCACKRSLYKEATLCAGRTVHEYGVKDIHADNLVTKRIQRAVLTFLRQFFAKAAQVKSLAAEHCFGSIGNDPTTCSCKSVLLHQLSDAGSESVLPDCRLPYRLRR